MSTKTKQALAPIRRTPSSEVLMQFRRLADCSPAGLFLVDSQGICAYVNPHAAAILKVAQPIAGADSWPQTLGVENPASVLATWHATASNQYSGAFRVQTAGSSCRWIEVRTSPIEQGGSIVGHSGILEDISDLWLSARRLAARDAITRILAGSDSIEVARHSVLNEIGEILGWAMGVFWELDEQRNLLLPAAIWRRASEDLTTFESATRDSLLPPGIGLPGRVWSTKQPAWLSDVTRDANFPRLRAAAQTGLHGAFAFPVTVGSDILGVIEFFTDAFWESDSSLLQLASSIGSQIGQFIARRRRHDELRQSEEKFWQVAQNIGEVLWISDPLTEHLVYISPAFESIWGCPREPFLHEGSTFFETIHPDDRARVITFRNRAHRGVRGEEEYRIVRPDNTISWVRDLAFPVNNVAGSLAYVVGLSVDISERIDREQRRAQLAKAAAIATLASGLAHDLNNLLTVVLGNASLLSEMLPTNDAAKTSISELTRAGHQAAYIVAQMLAYAGKGRFVSQPIDLSRLIGKFSQDVMKSLPGNIELQIECESRLPAMEGDPNQLLQLIGNLYLNAVEAIGDTPGRITISTRIGQLDSESGNAASSGVGQVRECVCLCVTDTGCGIDQAIRARIFDPFFTTKFVGRGLGLSAAAGIVSAHNGVIQVDSAPGRGSTFICKFPLLDSWPRASPHSAPPIQTDRHATRVVRHYAD